jgi:hypothetical protein
MKLLIMNFLHPPVTSPLWSKYAPQHICSPLLYVLPLHSVVYYCYFNPYLIYSVLPFYVQETIQKKWFAFHD